MENQTQTQAQAQAQAQTQTQPNENVVMNVDTNTQDAPTKEVTLTLLNNLRALITVAGDRGAYKTAEMYGVGLVYNELTRILESA